MEGPLFSVAASLDERISLQPVRSRLAPQERCAQLSCASKPGGFMQPSGAPGAHGFLVRSRVARRKRKEQENAARGISPILSALTCGFLGRQGFRDSLDSRRPLINAHVFPRPRKRDRPIDRAVTEIKLWKIHLIKRVSRS